MDMAQQFTGSSSISAEGGGGADGAAAGGAAGSVQEATSRDGIMDATTQVAQLLEKQHLAERGGACGISGAAECTCSTPTPPAAPPTILPAAAAAAAAAVTLVPASGQEAASHSLAASRLDATSQGRLQAHYDRHTVKGEGVTGRGNYSLEGRTALAQRATDSDRVLQQAVHLRQQKQQQQLGDAQAWASPPEGANAEHLWDTWGAGSAQDWGGCKLGGGGQGGTQAATVSVVAQPIGLHGVAQAAAAGAQAAGAEEAAGATKQPPPSKKAAKKARQKAAKQEAARQKLAVCALPWSGAGAMPPARLADLVREADKMRREGRVNIVLSLLVDYECCKAKGQMLLLPRSPSRVASLLHKELKVVLDEAKLTQQLQYTTVADYNCLLIAHKDGLVKKNSDLEKRQRLLYTLCGRKTPSKAHYERLVADLENVNKLIANVRRDGEALNEYIHFFKSSDLYEKVLRDMNEKCVMKPVTKKDYDRNGHVTEKTDFICVEKPDHLEEERSFEDILKEEKKLAALQLKEEQARQVEQQQ